MREAAADAGVSTAYLDGSTRNRQQVVDEFKDGDADAFFISLKAGGTGLNLTRADHVIHFDRWWNPAVEYQAMDRIHRLGQHRPVQAIKLVVEDSIESRIIQLQEKKAAMVDATLSADDSAMGRLTPEDVRVFHIYIRRLDRVLTVFQPQLGFLFRL